MTCEGWPEFRAAVETDNIDVLVDAAMAEVCASCFALNNSVVVLEVIRDPQGNRLWVIQGVVGGPEMRQSLAQHAESIADKVLFDLLATYDRLQAARSATGRIVLVLAPQVCLTVFRSVEKLVLSRGGTA